MSTHLLHERLRSDVERLAAINAGLWVVLAAAPLLIPAPLLALFRSIETGSRLPAGTRAAGALLLGLGIALALVVRRPLGRRALAALALADGLLALGLLVLPFALRLELGFLAWAVTAGLSFALASGASAWFFVRDRVLADAARRARQEAPPSEVPDSSSS